MDPEHRRLSQSRPELDALWDALRKNVLLKSRALEEQWSEDDVAKSPTRLTEDELSKPSDGYVSDGALVTATSSRKRPYAAAHGIGGASSAAAASRKRPSVTSDEPRKRARLRAPTASAPRVCGAISKQGLRGEK